MRLQEIMTREVSTVGVNAPAEDARELMRRDAVRHLVVLDGRRPIGVISDRDLGSTKGKLIADLMSAPVVTATPRTTVREAANLLRGRTIGSLPIVEGGKVVGIITVTDLLELIGKGAERPVARTAERRTMRDRGPRKVKERRAAMARRS
jgi:acetoin utilization protein AcuB